jgi:putative peptidoglycan lipid II flippase
VHTFYAIFVDCGTVLSEAANTDLRPSLIARVLRILKPGHTHTATTATLLLMLSAFLSRIMGLAREKFTAYLFGAGGQMDAYRAAFQLPDTIAYFLVGGAASITFITMLNRYYARGEEAEGERVMSVIISVMLVVLGVALLAAELLAGAFVRWYFAGYSPEKAALATHMTRILLPAQLMFFIGGVLSAVLLVRKQFAYQALSPLVYALGIICGGFLLHRSLGVTSLAVGATAGAFFGPFLLNAIGAHRAGVRFRFDLNWGDKGLHEWAKLSIPLMLGLSLVTVDGWIIACLTSHENGLYAKLYFAKQLFTVPIAIVGQAAGAASMPFFVSLLSRGERPKFAEAVNDSVTRILAISFLLTAWMMALSGPAVDLVLRGGALRRPEAAIIAAYFALFSVSLCLWSAQAFYARAFYAAGDTLRPMVASTIVTVLSVPVYLALYRLYGGTGLVMASNLGILAQTLVLAVMLHRQGLVRLTGLGWAEMARSLAAACVAGAASTALLHGIRMNHGFRFDVLALAAGTLAWLLVAGVVLQKTGSSLPAELKRRLIRS